MLVVLVVWCWWCGGGVGYSGVGLDLHQRLNWWGWLWCGATARG